MEKLVAKKYIEMMLYGAESLAQQKERINALNVFPVPDGDTGTNMNMTIQGGIKPLSTKEFTKIEDIALAVSKGMLLGARGNSGVILSQFFRGLAEGFKDCEAIEVKDFQRALKKGRQRAYNSVIKAVEGTILTVIKDLAEFSYNKNDFEEYFDKLIECGLASLDNTPNLLPVLKEVGVVDSGGAGLMEIFKGMQASLHGEELKIDNHTNFETFLQTEEHPLNIDDIKFGYCTEMLINLKKEVTIEEVRAKLETFGDSIVAIQDDGILKTHVHTEEPIKVFNYGLELGEFIHIKSENMRVQAEEANGKIEEKENGIVIVAPSKEMAELYQEIQDVEVIVGGQTLNPSTEDIIKAIKATHAKNVLVFPNNSNIIMASEAAKALIEDKNIEIIKTKNMTQGLECLIAYNPQGSIQENIILAQEAIAKTINYEITYAIRDTVIDGLKITKDDYLVMKEGKIIKAVKEEKEALNTIMKDLALDTIEIINVLIGIDGKENLITEITEELEEESPFLEIQTYQTNQPVYSYLISAIKE
ncbi:MAG: DAK2 domain-containing protein [Mycoplasmatales bacterium]